jgi:hypothetical protein
MEFTRGLLAIGIGALCLVMAACGEPPEAGPISDVIRGGMTAELNVQVPPAAYYGGVASDEMQRQMFGHAQTELSRYYSGAALTKKLALAESSIRQVLAQQAGYAMGGGVSDLRLTEIQVTGNSAHVKAEITIWFTVAQSWTSPRPTPPAGANILQLDCELVKGPAGWRISQASEQFAPGGGP